MKALGVDRVHNFPFPTQPERGALQAAEACLVALSGGWPGGHRRLREHSMRACMHACMQLSCLSHASML
jgi:hypothetical protein